MKAVAGTGKGGAEEKEQTISETFDRIEISEISADVILREAKDGQVKVAYCDTDRITHSYKVHSISGEKVFPEGSKEGAEVSVGTTSGDVELRG